MTRGSNPFYEEAIRTAERRYRDPRAFMVDVRRRLAYFEITQKALAAESGISEQRISKYVRFRIRPGVRTMMMIDLAMATLEGRKLEET